MIVKVKTIILKKGRNCFTRNRHSLATCSDNQVTNLSITLIVMKEIAKTINP